MTSRTGLIGLALLVAVAQALACGAMWPSAVAPAAAQDDGALVEEGQKVFMFQGCYGCHTIGTMGTEIGPDLTRMGSRYPREYLVRWLRDPVSVERTAHMPKLDLKEREIGALAAFLAAQR